MGLELSVHPLETRKLGTLGVGVENSQGRQHPKAVDFQLNSHKAKEHTMVFVMRNDTVGCSLENN